VHPTHLEFRQNLEDQGTLELLGCPKVQESHWFLDFRSFPASQVLQLFQADQDFQYYQVFQVNQMALEFPMYQLDQDYRHCRQVQPDQLLRLVLERQCCLPVLDHQVIQPIQADQLAQGHREIQKVPVFRYSHSAQSVPAVQAAHLRQMAHCRLVVRDFPVDLQDPLSQENPLVQPVQEIPWDPEVPVRQNYLEHLRVQAPRAVLAHPTIQQYRAHPGHLVDPQVL